MCKGAAALSVRSNTDHVPKPSSLNCPDASCPSQAGLPQNPRARQRSSCRKPLFKNKVLAPYPAREGQGARFGPADGIGLKASRKRRRGEALIKVHRQSIQG
jgi:hypothetical protein